VRWGSGQLTCADYAHDQAQVKADFWAIFDVGDAEPGDQDVALATRQAAEFAEGPLPAAVAVTDDLASLTVQLRFPAGHWRRIRDSNFIERTFGEPRRRRAGSRLPAWRIDWVSTPTRPKWGTASAIE
jgi:hypothetical protein